MALDIATPGSRTLRWLKLLVAVLGAITLGPMILMALVVSFAGMASPSPDESIWASIALSLGFFALGGGGIAGLIALALTELVPAARNTPGLRRVLRVALAWGVLASAVVGLLMVGSAIDTATSEFAADPAIAGPISLGLFAVELFLMCGLGAHSWRLLGPVK